MRTKTELIYKHFDWELCLTYLKYNEEWELISRIDIENPDIDTEIIQYLDCYGTRRKDTFFYNHDELLWVETWQPVIKEENFIKTYNNWAMKYNF